MTFMRNSFHAAAISIALLTPCCAAGAEAQLTIPGHTAYMEPDPNGARIGANRGVTRWSGTKNSVNWFGKLGAAGELRAFVDLQLPEGESSRLRLTIDGIARETVVTGANGAAARADFGVWNIKRAGYKRFRLESLNGAGKRNGDVLGLLLDGAASKDAHFNLKPRRNAASVHLFYPLPGNRNISAFHCEMTAVDDPVHSYYMACGWHRGYFGMQVNSETERRIIFSVWDSGNEAVDRGKVSRDNRVALMAKGEDVIAKDFGNEGTGGHSHLKYQWKTGEKQRFLITAEPVDKTFTIYSGYYFHPDRKRWTLVSSWRAPKDGGWLRGLYSFSENFGGRNGQLRRKAFYGNQWIRDDKNAWSELTVAKFSHDVTGKADRLDRFMGLEKGEFFLSHGGFVDGFTEHGEAFTRPALNQAPQIVLPEN